MKKRRHGEGSIHQNKSGRWVARFWTETPTGKKRRYIYGKSRKEVQEKLISALAERDRGVVYDDQLTVAEFLESWLESMGGTVKPVTLERYRTNAERHIIPPLGKVKLSKLRPPTIQRLYDAKRAEGLSPASIRLVHGVLSASLNQALRWQLIQTNPAAATKRPKQVAKEIKPLSEAEANRLLDAASEAGHRLESLFVLALTTGARVGELLAARWSDFDGATLRIERTVSAAKHETFSTPKGGRARTVHLTPRAIESLRSHRSRQAEERLKAVYWEDPNLIFSTTSGGVLRLATASEALTPLLDKAGLPSTVRFHDLRHTCATLLLSRGVDVVSVQRLLGHASAATTLGVYAHYLPSMGEATAKAMESALG